ncbi:MAG: MBL fold metallo-hydrolase [Hyphomicrobiales bacterium]
MSEFKPSRRNLFQAAGVVAAAGATATTGFVQPVLADGHPDIPTRPFANKIAVGNMEVTTILDGAIQLPGPHPIFGQNVDAAQVKALAEENFLPGDKMEIGFTPTIVRDGTNTILFDTGNGEITKRRPKAGNLVARMALAGIKAEEVTHVVITHMHPDHIGGLMEGGKPTFPNAAYVTAAAEYDFWSPEDKLSGGTERVAKLVQANVKPLAEKFSFIKPGDSIAAGITALDASGHTPGQLGINIESNGERLVLIADSANHYVVSLQRPDWHVRFDMDKEKAAATRKSLLGMIAADKVPFIGYHMPFPAVGYLTAKDQGFHYTAASYQGYLDRG